MTTSNTPIYASQARPWLKFYDQKYIDQTMPACTAFELVCRQNKNRLGETALEYYGRKFTYADFIVNVKKTAAALRAAGLKKGDIATVVSVMTPEIIFAFYAADMIGATLNLVDPRYSVEGIREYIEEVDSHLLICLNVVYERCHQAAKRTHVEHVVVLSPADSLPLPLALGYKVKNLDKNKYHSNVIHWKQFLAAGKDESIAAEPYDPEHACVVVHTGGTTGSPKGVMLTHVNIVNNGYWIGYHQKFSSRDRVCLPVPLFHCFGCVLGVMACVNHGATMVLLDAFSPVQVMTAVEQEKCTALYGVPTMFQAILDHRVFSRFDFSSLRTGIMAGSVCPEPLMRRVMDQMCMSEITICYGLTEGSPVMTQTRTDDTVERRVKTVGRSMPGIEVTIRDPETNEEVPRNAVGEVCCRGYNVMQGYYNMPKDTAEAIDEEGWLHSGDLGIMDEDGYVSISGRIKDMIIRGGENVYPREVEEFLLKMDGVADVQVVAVPSRRYGEEVGAFLIPKEGADVAPEDVRDYCRGKIAWYKIPRYVAVVEGFPLTASGKIQKYKLREMAAAYFPEAMRERNGLPSRGRRGTA